MFPGSTDFSDSLYDLRWENAEVGGELTVKISWKSTYVVSYGLMRLDGLDTPDQTLGRTLSNLEIRTGTESPHALKIIATVRYEERLMYRYRYLLSCQTGLQAFWRLRILQDVTQGSIPLDICKNYPYWCDTVHKTEAVLSYVGPETQRRPRNAPHDLEYEVAGIVSSPAEFSSNAEAEFYLKGALLYEEHVVSEIRKRFLDGKQIYDYWTEPLPRRSDRPNTTDWLMFVTLEIDYASETAELLEISGQVVITWINSAREVYVTDDCLGIGVYWEYVKADLTIKKRCTVTVIVGQRYGDVALYHYE